jgi:hypothetical protein
MSRTTHTMTVTFTVQSNAPEAGVDLDIEAIAIAIDGDSVCTSNKVANALAERHIIQALHLLEGY